jgi:hypothetical protein
MMPKEGRGFHHLVKMDLAGQSEAGGPRGGTAEGRSPNRPDQARERPASCDVPSSDSEMLLVSSVEFSAPRARGLVWSI